MSLEIVAERPGLWRDPGWTASMPGVYALVAGVSAYAHLDGGSGTPAADDHGLEQLISSAGTAAGVFDWLRQSFRRQDMPVVWCYLLLAPTAAERADFDARGLRHYAEPSYVNLQQAIQLWAGNLPRPAAAARASRTLFFFSGHGVQANWNALLLPSDYLDPDLGTPPHYQNCVSTAELRKWMEENPVGEHLALLDACRNEFSPLASMGATANTVFPINPPGGATPRTAASLAAASPNTIAYQLQGRPLTVFGEAVLEAVRGEADPTRTELPFRELVDYVKPRVNVLLKAANTTLEQTVRPRIDGDDNLVVTEIARPLTRSGGGRGPGPGGMRGPAPGPGSGPGAEGATRAIAKRAEDALLANKDAISLADLRGPNAESYRRFGHEYASNIWSEGGVALYSLIDGQRLASGATLLQVLRDEASTIVHVDLALDPAPGGVLLVFEGDAHVQRKRLAVALPTDEGERVPIRLSLGFARPRPNEDFMLQSLSARLGPGPWNPHYTYIWELTQQAQLSSLLQAAERADPERLEGAIADKTRAQTAAIASALLLARAGQIGKVGEWPRNLMTWFPEVPDGAVLWAAALQAAGERGGASWSGVADPRAEIVAALAALLERGAPFFADALDLADRLVRQSLRGDLEAVQRRQLERLSHAIERIFEVAMPGGDFIVLPGLPRPPWLGAGDEAISTPEMLRVLRGPTASAMAVIVSRGGLHASKLVAVPGLAV